MAGMPPGAAGPGSPGTPPPAPPMPPPQMPPSPMGPPGGGQPGGLGAGSPLGPIFHDLSLDLTPPWQLVDMGVRCFRAAIKTAEFQQSKYGKVNAVIKKITDTATTLLSHYTSGQTAPGAPRPGDDQGQYNQAGSLQSSDADATPPADGDSEP